MVSINAHAARIDENNIVREVIVIPHMDDDDDKITEFCNSIGLAGRWLDTSYLGARRYNYAGLGYTFDPDKGTDGAFIPPKPEPTDEIPEWVLNEETCLWEPVEA